MALKQLTIKKKITVRSSNSIEKYLQQVKNRSKLLTADQEVELTQTIQKGLALEKEIAKKRKELHHILRVSHKSQDPVKLKQAQRAQKNFKKYLKKCTPHIEKGKEAQKKLITANLLFVISVAKPYQNQALCLTPIDIINEGNRGLIKAAVRFKPEKGFKFISYAVTWIRQNILQSIHNHGQDVRIPLNRISLIQKVYRAQKRLQKELERIPTALEISEELEIPIEKVTYILTTNNRTLSTDSPLREKDNESSTYTDVIENRNAIVPDSHLLQESDREELETSLQKIPERLQRVLRSSFGFDREDGFYSTTNALSTKMRLTPERVRQIKEKALTELKQVVIERQKVKSAKAPTLDEMKEKLAQQQHST